jgi:hypothetical protein
MNRNADATQEFLEDAVPIAKTRDERIAAARIQIAGGQQLAKHLIEQAQIAVVQGRANDALLFRGEVEEVLRMVRVKKSILDQDLAEETAATVIKRWPNFFERRELHQSAQALGKSEDQVLSDRANLGVADRKAWRTQKRNRNIDPSTQGVAGLMGATKERDLVNEKAVCARHCSKEGRDVQGRSNCPYCQGAGFHAAMKIKEGK